MVRKRKLTIDITAEIQAAYDEIEVIIIENKGKEYWKTLDKALIQTFIFNKIKEMHYNFDKIVMRDTAVQYVLRIDEMSNE